MSCRATASDVTAHAKTSSPITAIVDAVTGADFRAFQPRSSGRCCRCIRRQYLPENLGGRVGVGAAASSEAACVSDAVRCSTRVGRRRRGARPGRRCRTPAGARGHPSIGSQRPSPGSSPGHSPQRLEPCPVRHSRLRRTASIERPWPRPHPCSWRSTFPRTCCCPTRSSRRPLTRCSPRTSRHRPLHRRRSDLRRPVCHRRSRRRPPVAVARHSERRRAEAAEPWSRRTVRSPRGWRIGRSAGVRAHRGCGALRRTRTRPGSWAAASSRAARPSADPCTRSRG